LIEQYNIVQKMINPRSSFTDKSHSTRTEALFPASLETQRYRKSLWIILPVLVCRYRSSF